ncbi:unnamed protein product [Owenia fusiformis]|uniref:Uncharacterized protein n=1 Tax=Owenia fusiformis TaxID=6347 RepID=A0A8J1TFT5_OWEFU|nr:unnamed protein product [Owenia fusiformis]
MNFLGKIKKTFSRTGTHFAPKESYYGCLSKHNIEQKLIPVKESKPLIGQLQMREISVPGNVKRYEYGTVCEEKHMVIMFVGGTGSGKSTMINSFANYLFGIEWGDPYRIRVVDENIDANQAESVTQNVSTYTFYKERRSDGCTLTIIDTPGFADTSGKDDHIANQIGELFTQLGEHGINSINAVGFVVEASRARLTILQRYIYEKVLSPFGKDIKENIAVLTTFADDGEPIVLDALRQSGLEYKDYYKFNNGATFAEYKGGKSDDFNKKIWSMMIESFDKVVRDLQFYHPKSLTLSKAVLKERDQLKLQLIQIKDDVTFSLNQVRKLNMIKQSIEQYKVEIEENKEFIIEVEEPCWEKEPSNWSNNCIICKRTCHKSCWAFNVLLSTCEAFNSFGHCTVCPGHCSPADHIGEYMRWNEKTKKVMTTHKEMRKRYMENVEAKSGYEDMHTNLENEVKQHNEGISNQVQRLTKVINRLKEIALKPGSKSAVDYIDDLIKEEAESHTHGFDERIQALEEIKKRIN